ncbi:MAG: MnhB domain-containing protein [Ilumatobacter sp.]|uniref:MnhB domain-containing protein n=1 Tax=Ilumatobacter sp. TaxID=1967498 RepID=UPI003C71785B
MIADRSLVVQDGIRLASPLAIVVATVLFFAGHNQPGGGFAGGLVLGAVMALRSATGLSVPQHPVRMMSVGGMIIGCVALAPIVIGDVVLDQYVWTTTLPVLGKVKAGTALILDVGVVLIVVGLILAMLDALSSAGPSDVIPTPDVDLDGRSDSDPDPDVDLERGSDEYARRDGAGASERVITRGLRGRGTDDGMTDGTTEAAQ